ncbi:ABC transporter ATP-binding protein [Actinokineospora sp. HUAS TT18]|uniref:ABC transporter ATP-binding protein n=1 Tax=Actinokineospora sp. HUAS TT18 TaxID=3447451 RepID=UPI003F51E7A9
MPIHSTSTGGWIAAHLRRHSGLLLVFVIGAAASTLAATLVPVFLGRAFGAATGSGESLLAIAGAVVGLVVGRFAADLIGGGAIEIVAQRVKRDARDELYRSLLGKRQSFHDRQRVGDILARAINDARLVDYLVSPGIATAFTGVLALLVPIGFIAAADPRLLLAPAVVLLVFAGALWHHLRRLHPLTVDSRRAFADLNDTFAETLAGMPTIKALTKEDHERGKFVTAASAYRSRFLRRGRAQAVYLPGLSFALGMAIGGVHALSLYGAGEMALPDVITYLGWLALFAQPVSMSEQAVPVLQDGYVAAARMRELTGGADTDIEETSGLQLTVNGRVTFEHVSLSLSGKEILHDVSFDLPAGETLAVVGTTGSGKSMLTKLVNRTYDATSGRVLIDGRDVREWEPAALRRQIATVHQDPFLFSKSVHDNIAFGSPTGADPDQVHQAARQAQADEFVRELDDGYQTVLNEGGTTLSGGQRQRLVIARALIADPAILTLDDATSAVDATTERAITTAVGALMAGRTTILISHRPGQIRRADLVLLLDRGRVADLGTHAELVARSPLYREIYSD